MAVIINFDDIARFADKPDFDVAKSEFHQVVDTRRSHAAEPIKNMEDIYRITDYLVEKKRYRDNLLFIMGINFGLRCGDILKMQVGHVIDPSGHLKEEILLREEKTDKLRKVYMNETVANALKLYLSGKQIDLNDYLFPSYSHNNSDAYYDAIADKERTDGKKYEINGGKGTAISVDSAGRILRHLINTELNIPIHAGTHCMRKTFAYHTIMNAPDRARAVEFLQMLLNHSSQSITLRYAGITDDEIRNAYCNLNLGGRRKMDIVRSSGLERNAV